MKILAIEPYMKGSHKLWLDGLIHHSSHEFKTLTLPGQHWKWRMHGGSIELAKQSKELTSYKPDLILFTDMMDVSLFLSLTREQFPNTKTLLYFHENQFSYPVSMLDQDKEQNRDPHYGFINMTSALSVDQCWFNSQYNQDSFLKGCQNLLKKMPDYNSQESVDIIKQKSFVQRLGLDLRPFNPNQKREKGKTLLWNHRWEYDKNPDDFFMALSFLKEKNISFRLKMLGKRNQNALEGFQKILSTFRNEIIGCEEINSREDYIKEIQGCDILPVTSNQEFFGISVAEAICAGVTPLLPNRLAYPELLPNSELTSLFLYNNQDDLNRRLEDWLTTEVPSTQEIQEHCFNYDWEVMIKEYDKKLELI